MKKVLLSLLLFLIPFSVKADTISYYIETNILENGDMEVKELKILDGFYNGVKTNLRYRNLNLNNFSGVKDDFESSNIYNASGLININVYDVVIDKNNFEMVNTPNKQFAKVNSASKGDYGVYTETVLSEGVDLLIYMPSSYNRASLVTYTLKDVVVVHNDIAEIAWDFINASYEENINDLIIKVNLPSDSNELRVFSHGPLDGVNRIVDRNTVELVYDRLDVGNVVDMRVVFDKSIVPNATKKSNINGLDYILDVEKGRADDANSKREEANATLEKMAKESVNKARMTLYMTYYDDAVNKVNLLNEGTLKAQLLEELALIKDDINEKNAKLSVSFARDSLNIEDYDDAVYKVSLLKAGTLKSELLKELEIINEVINEKKVNDQKLINYFCSGWFVGLIILVVFVYKKYDKEHTGEFNNEYYREIPDDFTPGVVSYLMDKQINDEVFPATVMELIRKDVIFVKETTYKESGLFNNKEKEDYKFIKNFEYDLETLPKSEKKLVYLLFELIGTGKSVTLSKIKKYAKNSETANSFATTYDSWKSCVLDEAEKKQFFSDNLLVRGMSIIYSLLLLFILYISLSTYADRTIIYILLIPMVISLIYFTLYTKKTKKSIDTYRKWRGLKNYLNDFGTFEDKEIMHINLWERYLVYATVFGIADKVQKAMKVKVQNINELEDQILLDFDNRKISKTLNKSIDYARRTIFNNNALNVIETSLKSIADSSSSSSGGFGGGSSTRSGGGFGGGGSSGGRF